MKIRLPITLLALLLLTSPCSANGLGNDKAAHITASAAAGIATKANSGYRVVARVADNIIKILFR